MILNKYQYYNKGGLRRSKHSTFLATFWQFIWYLYSFLDADLSNQTNIFGI